MLIWIINSSCCSSGIFIAVSSLYSVSLKSRVVIIQIICSLSAMETIKVLQTTAVFHSLHQRQDKAIADKEQMICIITTLDLSESSHYALFISIL
jgi:hypothetical protein